MKPIIGTIVIYHCDKEQKEKKNNNQEYAPAIITTVWSDDCVNLKVLTDGDENLWLTSMMRGDSEYQWNFPVINE